MKFAFGRIHIEQKTAITDGNQPLYGARIASIRMRMEIVISTMIGSQGNQTAFAATEKGKTMNKWIWSIALKNAVAIICWTFLACHFGKWWIALFGALFLSSVELGKKEND